MSDATINLTGVESPYLAAYLGLWSMAPHVLEEAVARLSGIDLRLHVEQQRAARDSRGSEQPRPTMYEYGVTAGGVAILEAVGTLMKAESSFGDSTSTVMLRRTIRDVRQQFRAGKVRALMVQVDSPGGTTDGTEEVASELAEAAAEMPVAGFADGLAASAGYWVLSQATTISAGPTAIIGSIGTYAAVRDSSAYYAQQGIKVHVIRTSDVKGAGVPGTEITAKQLAEWQRMIDASQAVFTAAVASGRRVPLAKAQEWADARVHVGREALAIGLIDHVESFEAAVSRLESVASKSTTSKRTIIASGPSAGESPKAEDAGASPAGSEAATLPSKEADMSQQQNPQQQGNAAPAAPPAPAQTAAAPAPAQQELTQKPASMTELIAACPGASSDFLVDQAKVGASVAQAKDAFLQFQSAQIRARDEEISKLKSAQPSGATTVKKQAGVPVIESSVKPAAATDELTAEAGEATAEFEARVSKLVATGLTRSKAAIRVFAEDDTLRAEYTAEQTAARQKRIEAQRAIRGR